MIKLAVSFPLVGRTGRLNKNDLSTPKEFLYGTNLLNKKYNISYIDSRNSPEETSLRLLLTFEKLFNRLISFPLARFFGLQY